MVKKQASQCIQCKDNPIKNKKRGLCSRCFARDYYRRTSGKGLFEGGSQDGRVCSECSSILTPSNKSGKCSRCYKRVFWQENYKKESPKCTQCGVNLQTNNTTGLCYNKCYRTKLAKNYSSRKYKTDIQYRIALTLRNRLNRALKEGIKGGSAVDNLGCSIKELQEHLESKFDKGMSWCNHGRGSGKWNIDHIIPLSSFDLTKLADIKKACHYTNLQPLWAEDNFRKGAKIDG